ncbi:NAD(P)-dependent oxidoreductase [Psychromarinibacter sp. C21-152]|uniref:NAD(P)-dependent oxidoreductase n=1 Tax=Psychromarinibacter sediminicola TaxID=3033385 RepID=A0AAE3NTF4_9RHOB|nr:NAD(P)-dependent oxidoreductase [Psychromarinibacter sediminicola]MDF0602104.1 NAD(P)-dependent oxidoreductase [Psychromarinibacter sediminicola]
MSKDTDGRPVALVTGHTGFIGRALLQELPRLGWHARGLTDAQGAAIDLRDADTVAEAVDWLRPDAILHMGGVSGPMQYAGESAAVLRVNIEGTQGLLDAAARVGTRRVIVAGSVAGYATRGPSGPEPDSIYGLTKRVAELQAHLWARQTGGAATVLRIGSVYGPGRRSANPMHQMVEEALRDGRIRVAPHVMEPCIEISTCAALTARLVRVEGLRPRYDVVTDRPRSEEVADIVAELTGATVQCLSGGDDGAGRPEFPERFDAAPLFEDTGVTSAVSLRTGLRRLVDAFTPAA